MIPGVKRPCLDCGTPTLHGSRCPQHDAAMRRRIDQARPARGGYSRAHQRVRAARGPASAHPCITCGTPAHEWALIAGAVAGKPWAYSDDPNDYAPMCRPCHRVHDGRTRASGP